MARRYSEKRSYPININYFADKCRNIDNTDLRLSFQSENPTNDGGVWFRILHGFSMASYGEKITVTLTPSPAGTDVDILSECGMPTQLVDYGKNKSNVNVIFNYFESGFDQAQAYNAASAPAPEPVRAAAPEAAPAQAAAPAQEEAAAMFCPQCGKKHNPGDRFCGGCGYKLI